MTLTKQQLNELWELADKATPGPWCVAGVTHQWRICVHREDSNDCYEDHPLIWAEDDDHLACANRKDPTFIAACDPQTIKALIEMARGKK